MNQSLLPAPMARDLGHWSSCARMWRLATERHGDSYQAVSCGTRLEDLEALAAKRACRSTDESTMTFFRLPDAMRAEAAALDPGLLLSPGGNDTARQFVERFAAYLEFLGLSLELRARACIVAPAGVSREIVRPFADPEAAEEDTVVCCNLSDVSARVAFRDAACVSGDAETADAPIDSIALALEMGDCLVGLRRSILGYLPDEQGEPTFWFECLLRNKNSGARFP